MKSMNWGGKFFTFSFSHANFRGKLKFASFLFILNEEKKLLQ